MITLGIIGVVAALTLPTLIANYKKHLVVTRLKSTYSIINQAFLQSVADNGPAIYWDYSMDNTAFFNKYYAPYLKTIKICDWSEQDSSWTESWLKNSQRACSAYAVTSDGNKVNINNNMNKYLLINGVGIIFSYRNDSFGIDLNISKNRMIYGLDYFTLLPNGDFSHEGLDNGRSFKESDFSSFTLARNNGCDYISKGTITSIGKTFMQHCAEGAGDWYAGNTCGALIQCNGWKIPDDYPVKF